MRSAKGITGAEIAQQRGTSLRSRVIRRRFPRWSRSSTLPIQRWSGRCILSKKDRLIVVSFLFLAAAVTTAWMNQLESSDFSDGA